MASLSFAGKVLPGIELLIFDKDGTLMDVHRYWSAMITWRAGLICRRLGLEPGHQVGLMDSMGVMPGGKRIKPQGPVGIKKREVVMAAAVGYLQKAGCGDQEALCEEVFSEVDEISLTRLGEIIQPLPGLEQLMAAIAAAGCRAAVATTDRSQRAHLALECLGITGSMAMVVGADAVAKPKPDPEMVHLILEALQVPVQGAAMVGDAPSDVQMGLNAGLRASIAVTSGLTPERELRRITPHVLPDISYLAISAE